MSSVPDNLILRQLRGLRNELAAVLENQRRDRELITRLDRHMEERFSQVDDQFRSLRRELNDIRTDIVLLENGLLTRHNEILTIVRRLDEAGAPDPDASGPETAS